MNGPNSSFKCEQAGKSYSIALHHVGNYMAAFQSILVELSKQVKHKFPPKVGEPSSHRAHDNGALL